MAPSHGQGTWRAESQMVDEIQVVHLLPLHVRVTLPGNPTIKNGPKTWK